MYMNAECKTCRREIVISATPRRGPSGNDVWLCLFYEAQICKHCCADHSSEKHFINKK